jgi:long-subunit fatty acid transport protein
VVAGQPETEGGWAFVLGTLWNWEITSRIEVTLDYRGQMSFKDANSSTHHTELTWELELTKRLDLDISFIWDHTTNPQPDATGAVPEKNDYRMILALGLDF